MKKILFLSLLGLPILFLGGCSLINKNDSGVNTGDSENISQLEEQLSGLLEQFSGLQAENELLREYLSGAISSLKTLQEENQILQADVDKYKKMIVEDKLSSKNTNTTNQNNTTSNNLQQTQTRSRNRYNSSLGYSLMLPGKCFNHISKGGNEGENNYHWINNLNYTTNNDVFIQCLMSDDSISIRIHDYECDNEHNQQGQSIQFGNNNFILYHMIYSLEGREIKCYKTNYNNKTLRFSIEYFGTDNSIVKKILESINDPI